MKRAAIVMGEELQQRDEYVPLLRRANELGCEGFEIADFAVLTVKYTGERRYKFYLEKLNLLDKIRRRFS